MNVDQIIDKLLAVRGNKPGKQVDLGEDEIKFLIDKSLQIIKVQKMLVELEAPLHVCGDIHGQYYDLLRIFEHCGYPGEYNYLFLGDYVDRGKQSLETVCLLLCYKIKYPEKVTLLRGNHESSVTNRIYGFYDECKRRYNIRLWKSFTELFNYLPVAALIDDKILCMHGGLSPDLKSIENIKDISRPTEIPDNGLLCDLLWSDPDKEAVEYDENDRGVSVIFGEKVVTDFNKKNDLDLIIRAHQVVDDGYEFFANRQLITIFSAPNYCGEFDNSAGIMIIDDSLTCSLKVLRPVEDKIIFMHGGLSPSLKSLGQLNEIIRPTDVPDEGLLCDLVWSDPESNLKGWELNDRGVSYTFNERIIDNFLTIHNLEVLVRAHQVVEKGYEFFNGRKCVTIFSAPNYCGEFDNAGAMMTISDELVCGFKVFKPKTTKP